MLKQRLESMRLYRPRDLFFYACNCALRQLPGSILWIVVRHVIRAKTRMFLNF
ncbi:MAG TPA: hypothetical protein VKR29_04880 [Candidatus Binataceae bacterium]|nr:hypothetical protein [Candidatus Binataceae bacterium]